MKPHHWRLVFGTDRANCYWAAILQLPRPNILNWVRTYGGTRQFVSGNIRPVNDHARIERYDLLVRYQQGIDVDVLDPRLLHYELCEAHQNHFQMVEVDRGAAAHTFQRAVDLGLLHEPLRERRVQ